MNQYEFLKCASLTANHIDYEDVLNEDGTKTQTKTWTFTAEDLKNFVAALEMTKR
jgi:hypothetical protein